MVLNTPIKNRADLFIWSGKFGFGRSPIRQLLVLDIILLSNDLCNRTWYHQLVPKHNCLRRQPLGERRASTHSKRNVPLCWTAYEVKDTQLERATEVFRCFVKPANGYDI